MSSFGFCATYNDAVTYEVSTVYHPQPRILSQPDVILQYAADNADINVSTIDGHNTVHIMGVIKIISPSNAVLADMPIVKCKSKPNAESLAAVSHVPLLTYENNEVAGMSKIIVEGIDYDVILNEQICSKVDLLWVYGKWRGVNGLPGWNGFLEKLTKNNKDFTTSTVMFLPFIHHPASNKDTIYTTLDCAVRNAKSHGQNCFIITFDQPLYYKAREIVAAADIQSDIANVVVRLGGFHMLMSFLGAIGYIMEGSGLKEALSVIYAPNSVDKMLDGHAFARSVRGHGLVRVALMKLIYDKLKIDQNLQQFLDGYMMDIMRRTMSYDNIEESEDVLNEVMQLFNDEVAKLKGGGPTAQLWLQYIEMISIANDFIRAERLGLWNDHLTSVQRMLPYFHASGHFLYAKSAHLYLQDMIALKDKMDNQDYINFTKTFAVRRTNKFNCGTWTDMTIEQSLMKSMKTEGGVSRGRSTHESVLCKWIYGMHATMAISEEIEKFCDLSFDTADQHVDSRDSRIERDNNDIEKIVQWFTLHNPFSTCNEVVSISTGIVGNNQINCYNAKEIGLQSIKEMIGVTFDKITLKRSKRVVPLSSVNTSIMVHNSQVPIDPLMLFQRISLNKKFEENLCEYLQYELSPYPTALFDNVGMRKTQKSKIYQYLEPINYQLVCDNATYIIDGGFLMHRVVWQKHDTFNIIINKYINYLSNNFGQNTVVIFDGYSDTSKNIKAMEQLRRTAAVSTSCEVHFNESMEVPISQDKFLSNRFNKRKLIEMLIDNFEKVGISTRQSRDDADVLIVETAIEKSINNTTIIVGEDIDLLILLIARTQILDQPTSIFFKKPGKNNVETKIYSTESLNKYPHCKKNILFLHAMTGCDTTSTLFGKGKIKVMKMFEKRSDLHNSVEIFQQENCARDALVNAGIHFLLAMYGAPKSENSIDNYRYCSFAKLTRQSTAVKFQLLPPTSSAAQQHIFRVYYQIQTWLGKEIDPEQWGWELKNNILQPITTLLPPASDDLLNTIFCNCTKGCGGKCGCKKIGLRCSKACGHCRGQSCLNAESTSEEINEDVDLNTAISPLDVLSETFDEIQIEDIDDE